MIERTEIIQYLIDKIKAKSYLEIGMGPGLNFSSINCDYKICVDPNPTVPVTHKMTSDDFFNQNKEKFDVIFIDGLHWNPQVYNDINNSLNVLNDNGYIICHDINPSTEIMQLYPAYAPNTEWTGDCWKAWALLRSENKNLTMHVVDTDYGCGIISKGSQDLFEIEDELTWEYLVNNRKELLNLISVDTFKKIYE